MQRPMMIERKTLFDLMCSCQWCSSLVVPSIVCADRTFHRCSLTTEKKKKMPALLLIEFICCMPCHAISLWAPFSQPMECILRSLHWKTSENIPIIISFLARPRTKPKWWIIIEKKKSEIFFIVQTIKMPSELINEWQSIIYMLNHMAYH